jgi:hypothetical protein
LLMMLDSDPRVSAVGNINSSAQTTRHVDPSLH